MSALPWLPAWLHDGESFWSVANKMAWVLRASVSDVLDLLLGPLRLRREALIFTQMPTAMKLCEQLEIPVTGAGRSMFANIGGSPELGVRERWCLRVRYCHVCIEGCVHRTVFQDQTVTHCPVHQLKLSDACGYCGRAVDPLCSWAWTCNGCGRPLADPGGNWSQIFRTGTGDAGSERASPLRRRDLQLEGIEDWKLLSFVYEEHAAMAHALLARHRDCIEMEREAGLTYVDDVNFQCPVAAALLVCGAKLGLSAGAMSGGWPAGQAVNRYRSAFPRLEDLVWGAEEHQIPGMTRVATRILAVKCLEQFMAAARNGKRVTSVLFERESPFSLPKGAHSPAKLPALAEMAGGYCRHEAQGARSSGKAQAV